MECIADLVLFTGLVGIRLYNLPVKISSKSSTEAVIHTVITYGNLDNHR